MKKSWYSEAQIIGALKEHEAGIRAIEICRRLGISRDRIGFDLSNDGLNAARILAKRLPVIATGRLRRQVERSGSPTATAS